MPATAQLRVKTLDGEAITLRVLPTDTVASVKGKIQAFEGAGAKMCHVVSWVAAGAAL